MSYVLLLLLVIAHRDSSAVDVSVRSPGFYGSRQNEVAAARGGEGENFSTLSFRSHRKIMFSAADGWLT